MHLLEQLASCADLLGQADPGYVQNARATPELSRMLCPQQHSCSLADFKECEGRSGLDLALSPEPAILSFHAVALHGVSPLTPPLSSEHSSPFSLGSPSNH